MSTSKVSLNSRYLKARLKRFTRPLFLTSLGVISFFSFCVWEYSRNPEWRSASLDLNNAPSTTEAGFSEIIAQQSENTEVVNYEQPTLNMTSQQPGFLEQWLEAKRAESSSNFYQPLSTTNQTQVTTSRGNYSPEQVLQNPRVQEYRTLLKNNSASASTEDAEQLQLVTSTSTRNRTPRLTVLDAAMLRINGRGRQQNQPVDNQLTAQNTPTGPSGYTWGVTPRTSGVRQTPPPSTPNNNPQPQSTPTDQTTSVEETTVRQQTPSTGGFNYNTNVGTSPISQPIPQVSPNVPTYGYP
ncbi:MAG: hypothetical protein EA365_09885 [Gloeocapsa sp. DLM2.Bin57]|jgi:hypothetical protein|nr:MAG: hypothetical protein EA365_09885 [Gloeocapsa sp. DLM2.Bin57]